MQVNPGIILALVGLGVLLGSSLMRQRLRQQKAQAAPGLHRAVQLASFAAYGLIVLGLLLWQK